MENVYKHTGCKDWENGLFYENINLLLNRIRRRPNCGHPSQQEVCFSILCSPRPDLWPFYGFLCKRFSLYIYDTELNEKLNYDHPSFNSSLSSSHVWFSYIHNFIIILSRVYNESLQRPAPSWLVSLHQSWPISQRSRVWIPYKPEFFFRLSFCNCKSCVCNCDDHPSFNSSPHSSHIWFSYIHKFDKLLVTKLNSLIQLFFPYDSRIPSP